MQRTSQSNVIFSDFHAFFSQNCMLFLLTWVIFYSKVAVVLYCTKTHCAHPAAQFPETIPDRPAHSFVVRQVPLRFTPMLEFGKKNNYFL